MPNCPLQHLQVMPNAGGSRASQILQIHRHLERNTEGFRLETLDEEKEQAVKEHEKEQARVRSGSRTGSAW